MSDDLTTSKYYSNPDPVLSTAPLPVAPVSAAAAPRRGGFERLYRSATVIVGVAVAVCGLALFWMHQNDVKNGARSARKRTSNPFDFVLWLGGSDKTFEDVLVESQEREMDRWRAMQEESDFKSIDFENLPNWSESMPLYGNDMGSDFEQ